MAVAELSKSSSSPVDNSGERAPNFIDRARDYIESLKKEMRLVTWPSRAQVQATTAVVIATIFAFAAFFWIVDTLIGTGITRLFKFLAK